MTDAELNEAFAIYVEGEIVSGGFIVQIENYDGDKFVSPRQIPDYVKERGRDEVLHLLQAKLQLT